jgi:hypothetical protein
MIEDCDEAARKRLAARVKKLEAVYAEMSDVYQRNKSEMEIPLK